MQVGIALPTYGRDGRPQPLSTVAAFAEEAEVLGFDSVWVMDHFWFGGQMGGHDPMTTLAYLAARTDRVDLGTLVICNGFRHPGQLAREAAAVADAAPGRVILGVGAGWNQPEFDAFGFPFDHRVGRLAEALPALRSMLAGERVDLEGTHYKLDGAWVVTTAPAPRIWVAAGGERMLGLTARHADGWNTAWGGPDLAWFTPRADRLRAACEREGRSPGELTLSAGIFAVPVDGPADERVAVGGPPSLARLISGYEAAGVQHLIVNLSEAPFMAPEAPTHLARAAEALNLYRRS